METSKQQNIKCVLVGTSSVGKSTVLVSYMSGHFVELGHNPTVFDNRVTTTVIDRIPITLDVSDTAGPEHYDRLRPLSYPEADVFLIFFSLVDPSTYENVRAKWYPEVSHHMPDTPVVLVGTKADRTRDADTLRVLQSGNQEPIRMQMAEALMEKIGASAYVECSALTMEGIADVFREAVKAVWKKNEERTRKTRRCRIS